MSGLYASLNTTVKALGAHSRALEIAGKNVANVDNPGYARQRVIFGDRGTVLTPTGAESLGLEALGVGLPGNAAIPAVDARRKVLAREAGRRIVELVRQGITLDRILTRAAFEEHIVRQHHGGDGEPGNRSEQSHTH